MEACPAGVRGGAEEVALGAGQAAGGEGGSSWGAEGTRVPGVGAAAPLAHLVGAEAAVPSAHLAGAEAGPGEGGAGARQGEAGALPLVAGEAAAWLVGGAGEGAGGQHRLPASRCAAGLREDASAESRSRRGGGVDIEG